MNVRTKDVSAFDGQVTFCLLPYPTAQSQIVGSDILDEYPNINEKLVSGERMTARESFAVSFAHLYGNTFDIRFALKPDAPAALVNFREWWHDIGQSRDDTIAAMRKWLTVHDGDVAQAWDDAINETRQPIPQAAPELRPDAAQLAEGDANFPNDGSESSALSSGDSELT